jgi:ArsR family transcriptional regulator
MRTLEKIFKALADRNRIRILKLLELKPMCVCEITAVLGIAQSSVSRHLALLRDAGLIIDEKEGVWTNYSLSSERDDPIVTMITGLRRWGNDDATLMADRKKAESVDREKICGVG